MRKPVPDKKSLILNQLEDTVRYYGERFACVFMRKMTAFYIKGVKGASNIKLKLFQCANTDEVKEIINSLEI